MKKVENPKNGELAAFQPLRVICYGKDVNEAEGIDGVFFYLDGIDRAFHLDMEIKEFEEFINVA